MMVIETKFDIGQTVYLKTDEDQKARIVVRIIVTAPGGIIYGLACGIAETQHYDMEISEEKNVLA